MPATNFPNGIRAPLLDSSGAAEAAIASITDSTAGTANGSTVDTTALTDNSGGTADGTLAVVGATYDQATVANNFADCAAKINALRDDMATMAAKVNAILTALRDTQVIDT